ncbi:hypothetical protein Mterra_00253 [Calidithermus terrae]|uniref:Uncharacterized protein n=1 Tax=Calidithermus terrae TaxID=1408545 RepID=A0A399F7N8_9DEIN|nr:hypothetical protein Mterra_00253 [Calidithermus terrae]
MPKCRYCGQPTQGFLSFAHRECTERHTKGKAEIARRIELLPQEPDPGLALAQIKQIASDAFLAGEGLVRAALAALPKAIDNALDDHLLSAQEQRAFEALIQELGLGSRKEIQPYALRLVRAAVLRELAEGRVFEHPLPPNTPLLLQKGEKLAWVFQGVKLYEYRVHREYVSSGGGMSVRVAKGVYLRSSQIRTKPVVTERLELTDQGMLLVSTKHLYFHGRKAHRLALKKIVALDPYRDGIEVHPDGAKPRPRIYTLDDGWFAYNLITGLVGLAS